MNHKTLFYAFALGSTLLFTGCGGGGGGSSSGGGGGAAAAPVSVFVTDNLDNNDHVWVTLYKVDFLGTAGESTTVFDNSTGEVVDLRSLRDATGARFQLLSKLNIPAGQYSGARVTMGRALTVFPKGSTVGVAKNFESTAGDPANRRSLTFNFPATKAVGPGGDNIVLDFDLSQWEDKATGVKPVIKEGSKTGLDDVARHESDDFHGLVSSLAGTAPTQTFTIGLRGGGQLTVRTSADTVVYRENALPNPTISNNDRVEVRGKFNPATKSIDATAIKIEDASGVDEPELYGLVNSFDATAGTLNIKIKGASLVVPDRTNVNVVTTAATRFRARGGVTLTKADFFTALGALATPEIEVEGAYNATTGTITAKKLKIHNEDNGSDDHGGGPEMEAKGNLTSLNAANFTFVFTPAEWEGFSWTAGTPLTVNAAGATRFETKRDNVTKAEWFAQAATATELKAYGQVVNGVLQAYRVKIED